MKMNKNLLKRISLFAITVCAAFATFSASLAWLTMIANVDNTDISGETRGSYFKSGKGTADDPYLLDNPVHVYNLAWLQYIGFFNNGQNENGTGAVALADQVYFKLDGDIDMSEFNSAIPPIGTTKYPFIGNFDGADYTISNCYTSNDFGEIATRPSTITDLEDVECVGFFGVVGKLDSQSFTYSTSINEVKNFGLVSSTTNSVTSNALVGMLAGYAKGTITNVAVDSCTLDIKGSPSAIANIGTTRVSDYGIIGYSKNTKNITKYNETVYGVNPTTVEQFSVEDQGSSASWGGSINMNKIYTSLKNIWTNTANAKAVGSRTESYDKFGHFLSRTETYTGNAVSFPYEEYENRFSSTGSDSHYYVNAEIKSNNSTTSSFSFVKRTSNDTGQYISITGDRDILTNTTGNTTINSNSITGHLIYIKNQETFNCLSFSGSSVTNVTQKDNANVWTLDTSAHTLYSYSSSSNNRYYLTCNTSGVLSTTTNSSAIWYFDGELSAYYALVNNVKHYLCLSGSTWTTVTTVQKTGPAPYFYISNGRTGYLTHAGTSGSYAKNTDTSSPDSNTNLRWYQEGDYFTPEIGSGYYLRNKDNSADSYISASTTYRYTLTSDNYLYNTDTGYYCYRKNSNWWEATKTKSSATKVTITHPTITYQGIPDSSNADSVVYSSETYRRVYDGRTFSDTKTTRFVHSYPTYWPLKSVGDDTDATNDDVFGVPAEGNTGYIVGGANYTGDPSGDIRFSSFSGRHRQGSSGGTNNPPGAAGYSTNKASLRNSYTKGSNSFDHVYTIDDSGKKDIITSLTDAQRKAQYPKYDKAAAKLITNLKTTYTGTSDSGEIPGLHFMDANITYGIHDGVDKSAYVESAIINKVPYTHYEVPTTCIDFNLKDKGRITFFAGTYFWGNTTGNKNNNCFFSLHTVERYTKEEADAAGPDDDVRENGIKSIKEIKYIYKHKTQEEADFVYQYSDNSYSILNFSASNYEKVFDTAWIKKQTSLGAETSNTCVYLLDAAYYFEIPVNGGEFALGSVEGGDGGYLMYLDIGANAALLNRSVFGEKNVQIKSDFTIPLGVELVPTGTAKTTIRAETVNPELGAFISIYAGNNTKCTLTRSTSTSANLSVSSGVTPKYCYAADDIALTDPGGTAEVVPRLKTTVTTSQTLFLDYNAALAETTKTAIVTTNTVAVNDFGQTTTSTGDVKSYWQWRKDSETNQMTKYTTVGTIVFYNEEGTAVAIDTVSTRAATSDTVIKFKFKTENGAVATIELELAATVNQSTHYYVLTGYNVVVKDANNNPIKVTSDVQNVTISDPDTNGTQTVTVTVAGQQYVFTFNPYTAP